MLAADPGTGEVRSERIADYYVLPDSTLALVHNRGGKARVHEVQGAQIWWSFATATDVGGRVGEIILQKVMMINITFEPELDTAYVHFEESVAKGAAVEQP